MEVHGATLTLDEVSALARASPHSAAGGAPDSARPAAQARRRHLVGALILAAAMKALGAAEVTVSDRGLRWGLLMARFGKRA